MHFYFFQCFPGSDLPTLRGIPVSGLLDLLFHDGNSPSYETCEQAEGTVMTVYISSAIMEGSGLWDSESYPKSMSLSDPFRR